MATVLKRAYPIIQMFQDPAKAQCAHEQLTCLWHAELRFAFARHLIGQAHVWLPVV